MRERISTLNAAILRISATLDLDTVLAEVVESACGLTGARYGVMITVDETGAPQDSVFSGVPSEKQEELLASPGNSHLWKHLRELPGPLPLADFSGYVRSLGIAPAPPFSRTFQSTPMRHRGADVGNLFLAGVTPRNAHPMRCSSHRAASTAPASTAAAASTAATRSAPGPNVLYAQAPPPTDAR